MTKKIGQKTEREYVAYLRRKQKVSEPICEPHTSITLGTLRKKLLRLTVIHLWKLERGPASYIWITRGCYSTMIYDELVSTACISVPTPISTIIDKSEK